MKFRSQIGKDLAPSATAANSLQGRGVKCLADAAVVLSETCTGKKFPLHADRLG